MLSMSPSKRRDTDMMKLMMSDFEVHIPDESSMHDFLVAFPGPEDTPYTGGIWKVHVTLPKEYPFKSPSIGFENRMFHPNVDEMSGSVCLDVINQTWSPMFDLVNIFKLFIPQLLSYPNPTDPLNGEAAALLMRDPEAYAGRIRDCVRLYASDPVHLDGSPVIVATANDSNTNSNNANPSSSSSSSSSSGSGGGGGGGGGGRASASASASGSTSANASASAIGAGSSSGGRSNSIGSDTSGISGISIGSGISGISSDESDSSEEKPPATAADDANGDRGDSAGGSGSGSGSGSSDNRRENDKEGEQSGGDNDATMGEGGGKAGDVKRRDPTAAGNGGGGGSGNSCRSSSSSEFMMEMDMDETASDVSALSDVDG